MLEFPAWYLLLPLAIVFVVTAIFLFFNVYHIAKFGLQAFLTSLVLMGYIVSYAVVLGVIVSMLSSFNWSQHISLGDIIPLSRDSERFGI